LGVKSKPPLSDFIKKQLLDLGVKPKELEGNFIPARSVASKTQEKYITLFRLLGKGWVREHKFHPARGWLLDFANPGLKLGVEINGSIWKGSKGGHSSGTGILRDMEKLNAAIECGWVVLVYDSETGKNCGCLEQIKRMESKLSTERAKFSYIS
jgi:hypothetical protein